MSDVTRAGGDADTVIVNRPDFVRADGAISRDAGSSGTVGGLALALDAVEPALERHLAHCRATVAAAALATPPTWETLMQPQAEAHNALSLFWSPISHPSTR